jgi:hypothetical protein
VFLSADYGFPFHLPDNGTPAAGWRFANGSSLVRRVLVFSMFCLFVSVGVKYVFQAA